jgi:hypothetical protein
VSVAEASDDHRMVASKRAKLGLMADDEVARKLVLAAWPRAAETTREGIFRLGAKLSSRRG